MALTVRTRAALAVLPTALMIGGLSAAAYAGATAAGAPILPLTSTTHPTARVDVASATDAPTTTGEPVAPSGSSATEIVTVTIPTTFRLDVIDQRVDATGCTQVIAVTDNRSGDPGWTVTTDVPGRLTAAGVPGNGLDASAVTVAASSATLPRGSGPGTVRLTGRFATCPAWTLS